LYGEINKKRKAVTMENKKEFQKPVCPTCGRTGSIRARLKTNDYYCGHCGASWKMEVKQ
jgi:ribosomal protein L37AE/L43A